MIFKKLITTVTLVLASSTASAVAVGSLGVITGSLGIGGAYNATGGTGLADATDFTISSVFPNVGSEDLFDDFNTLLNPGVGGANVSLTAFSPASNVLSIGGWQLDLSSLVIEAQQSGPPELLDLSGSGVISGNGYEATIVDWTMTAQSATSYSMAIISTETAVIPVPAAAWLFGSAMIGLSIIRRKS